DVDRDDQVGPDEAARVERPRAVRVRELLDDLLRAFHRRAEVAELADLDALAAAQADDHGEAAAPALGLRRLALLEDRGIDRRLGLERGLDQELRCRGRQ